ncbi:MAG TPA: C13 family peptidase [Xanthomonadaceae bacterium]|nr:C13 family peptidase [Xanthomonadaceae bacterium]
MGPPALRQLLGDLADGVRALLLRRARREPARAPTRLAWLAPLTVLLPLALGWLEVGVEYAELGAAADLPRRFDLDGTVASLATLGAIGLAAWLGVALVRRRDAFWALATRLLAAWIVFDLVRRLAWLALTYAQIDVRPDWLDLDLGLVDLGFVDLNFVDLGFAALWLLVVVRMLLDFDRRGALLRRLGAATTAFAASALLLALWLPQFWVPDWERMAADYVEPEAPVLRFDPETVMYAQPVLLDAALARLAPQRPGEIDLYALGFAGDGDESVFRNEVEFLDRLLAQRFDAQGRVLKLINHPDTLRSAPLATRTNLQRALVHLGRIMDTEQDIVFVFLTSHGSQDHWLSVNLPPLPLNPIEPAVLRAALDEAGIRWRVLVVSACYSGGFIEALEGPDTLLITAAREDRPSFGCGVDSEISYFGRAYLAEALNRSEDFVQAFELARESVAERERSEDVRASHPQIRVGEDIAVQLSRWRAQFEPGPQVPFEPDAAEVSEAAPDPL